ncbi:hypothetical protein BO86DRAFT_144027 [Aspergillus japonicus CBS 114.51]|uniref:Zn(2)-C6 fungal-type domain-containing protein n=1 Tax=Aspergillus japonicus CBS 114.51 TaxID=1448312 RepID=A0A8T8WX41_ASPJA|nr:hypothetical protein BO86DRAFT_144027 [Aspergillus japonicus CBS 114.51]RAH79952.1 hypothetical protein BO86DRAFT_144027 [Aspergillus japonicus CBS 114.51]
MSAPLGKKPTACVPCHERKVRCDSTVVGVPCTRCITRDRAGSCTLLERGPRTSATDSNKRRRTVHGGHEASKDSNNSEPHPEPASPSRRPPTPATSVAPRRHASFSHSQSDVAQGLLELSHAGVTASIPETIQPGLQQGPPVYYLASDEDAHLETLCRMADENPVMLSPVPLYTSEQGQQVIEYYGELNSITVLSEVLGQAQRRLIRLDLPGPAAVGAQQRELAGLDDADIAYLRAKHVHNYPPAATW